MVVLLADERRSRHSAPHRPGLLAAPPPLTLIVGALPRPGRRPSRIACAFSPALRKDFLSLRRWRRPSALDAHFHGRGQEARRVHSRRMDRQGSPTGRGRPEVQGNRGGTIGHQRRVIGARPQSATPPIPPSRPITPSKPGGDGPGVTRRWGLGS